MKGIFIPAAMLALVASAALSQTPPRPSPREFAAALRSPEFSPQVGEAVLAHLADALQAHSFPKTKSLFAADRFRPGFFDRMAAAFEQVESFRVYYHLQSAESEQQTVTADFRLEAVPRQSDEASRRQQVVLRLTLARLPQGRSAEWKIVAVEPSDFLFEF